MPYKDRAKRLEYQKTWYAVKENKERKIKSNYLCKKKTLDINKRLIVKLKIDHPCSCGEKDPCCLDFHHINGEKDKEISAMVFEGYGRKRIMSEIGKCEILCKNCHAKRHFYQSMPTPPM